jgi:hypothetical protein
MLPPAFIAQLGRGAPPAGVGAAAGREPARTRAAFARRAALARRAAASVRRLGPGVGPTAWRVAAWTLAWTLFEWWAVIGWPDALETRPAVLILGGVGTLVGLVVWRGVREPRLTAARVIPLGRPERTPKAAGPDEAEPDLAA